jgi:hypothetical protein
MFFLRTTNNRLADPSKMCALDFQTRISSILGASAVRTIVALWRAIEEVCDLFSSQECRNYFAAAGVT